ncbi:hypothetical protein J2X73_002541 [Novosphingobium sp. 1748]|uniref:tail completion protein gp17 n=1 Tax=Novosphingobium sp. 1748 TaxID=2817760 RepID=UPI002855FC2D|nr:DUF3168 domain-containing protein [Novosphingobium sp. 1748]MDR6708170.1 hypothetical protein [Novosphingobium sp. 1748]
MAGDPVAALVAALKADAGIAEQLGESVFGGELPMGEAASMPRKALVLKPSGGPSLTNGSNAAHDTQRIDVFAYGATPAEAAALMADVSLCLLWLQRAVWAQTLIHWVNSAGGYMSGREPDTDWPRVFKSFQVFHALQSVS